MSSTRSLPPVIDEAALLSELGILVPRQITCRTSDAVHGAASAVSELPGDRAVIKIATPFVAHKTEVGGVRIVAREEGAIVAAIREMALRLDAVEVTISEFVEHDPTPGGELLLAIRWTNEFGPIVSLGAGGTAAELLSSVAILAPGFATDASRAMAGKAFAPLVTGYRNQRAKLGSGDVQTLMRRCLAFAANRLPHSIAELEINPLVPTPRGLYALDVLAKPGFPLTGIAAARPLAKLASLLHPRSVAVMGVSSTAMNAGRVIVRNAVAPSAAAHRPDVQIVKAGEAEIDGVPCVADIASLTPVDLLVLAIPAEQIPAVVEECVATDRAESIIVIPGGLGEHEGSENLERRVREAIAAARLTPSRGPVVNGANCLGVASPAINTIFLPRRKFASDDAVDAPAAVVSQSGALAVSLMTKLAPFTPRYVVSLGNQLDLTAADYLDYFAQSRDLDVLAFYVEGFAALDGRRWFESAARVVREGRRVILYRAGRTPAGKAATSSHTAAIAGDVVIARELARATGVLFAESLEELEDLLRLGVLLRGRRASGRNLAGLSNAGFEAVAIADNLAGLPLASLSQATRQAIGDLLRQARLDRIVTIANPLDVNPMLDDAAFARVAELLLADPAVDAAVIGCVPLTGAMKTLPDEIADESSIVHYLGELWRGTNKPWVVVLDAGPAYDAMAAALHRQGLPVFRSADRATRALVSWIG